MVFESRKLCIEGVAYGIFRFRRNSFYRTLKSPKSRFYEISYRQEVLRKGLQRFSFYILLVSFLKDVNSINCRKEETHKARGSFFNPLFANVLFLGHLDRHFRVEGEKHL